MTERLPPSFIERFGDGVAQGSAGGTGIRIYNGGLFAEQNDKIIRYPLPANGFVPSEQPRGGPFTPDAVNRLIKRIGERARFSFLVSTFICCATPAATRWRTQATIRAPFRIGSVTSQSSTPSDTPS
jgi:hypothetical protein